MKDKKHWVAGMAAWLLAGAMVAGAQRVTFENRLLLRYDDNVAQRSEKTDSLAVVNDLMLDLDKVFDGGFVGLQYRTSVAWYEDRAESSDWDHFLTAQFSRSFHPRLTLALRDNFSYVDSPELTRDDGALLRRQATYTYNSLNASLLTVVAPRLHLEWSARHVFLRYKEDRLAEREDYDLVAAGLVVRSPVARDSSVFGEFRFESQDYKGAKRTHDQAIEFPGAPGVTGQREVPDRGSETLTFGLGVQHVFSPNLIGSVRAGYMTKDFDAANTGSESSPYGEASMTLVPNPGTRLTLSGIYSLYQSSLISFANQERTALAMNLAQNLGPKVVLQVGASYIESKYDAAESVDTLRPAQVTGGTEEAYSLSARAIFKMNSAHRMEAGVSRTDLSSDLRESFTRNRFDLGWNFRF